MIFDKIIKFISSVARYECQDCHQYSHRTVQHTASKAATAPSARAYGHVPCEITVMLQVEGFHFHEGRQIQYVLCM